MTIRILTPADAAIYAAIRLEALEGEPRAFSSSPEDHRALTAERIGERLRSVEEGGFVVGAFDGEELVGTAGFYREQQPKLRHKGGIWGVYVKPGWRGRGVSRAMMEAVLERIRGYRDLRQVNLGVAATQTAARRLYESLGFEEYGCERDGLMVAGEWVDEHWMALRLRKDA